MTRQTAPIRHASSSIRRSPISSTWSGEIPPTARIEPIRREALQHRADFLWDHGDLDAARRDYLASTAIGAALLAEHPNDLEILDKHASSLNNLSILFAEAGQSAERMRTLTDSTTLRERLVAATPADDPRRELFLSNLGSCYGNLGNAYMDGGDLDQAVTWTKKGAGDPGRAGQETSQLGGMSRTRRREPCHSGSDRAETR